jgi:hypothetical protein
VLAKPIVRLIFETGRYGPDAVAWTAGTVAFQCVGLLFAASQRIGTQALYALKDYRGPVRSAVVALLANIALSFALLAPLGTRGLALANGLSSLLGMLWLTFLLSRRLGQLPLASVLGAWLRMSLAAALMGLVAWHGARARAGERAGPHRPVREAVPADRRLRRALCRSASAAARSRCAGPVAARAAHARGSIAAIRVGRQTAGSACRFIPHCGHSHAGSLGSSMTWHVGHVESVMGGTACNRSFNLTAGSSLSVARSAHTNAIGHRIRMPQTNATSLGISWVEMAQPDRLIRRRITTPAHLKLLRVRPLTWGSLPHTEQCQRFQAPSGRTGMKKTCRKSNVRCWKARRCALQVRQ